MSLYPKSSQPEGWLETSVVWYRKGSWARSHTLESELRKSRGIRAHSVTAHGNSWELGGPGKRMRIGYAEAEGGRREAETSSRESGSFSLLQNLFNAWILTGASGQLSQYGFGQNTGSDFLRTLEKIIEGRRRHPVDGSYTSTLFSKGINAMAQKVGEEAVELVIEAKDNNHKLFLNEAADLIFHYLVLLQAKNKSLADVIEVLEKRHKH